MRPVGLIEAKDVQRERLYLFDTTLRDGAQTIVVDFSLADKLAVARVLNARGIDYVDRNYGAREGEGRQRPRYFGR